MAVLINFKICDNAPECGGIAVCPTGTLSYDEKSKTIVIKNEKCLSCRACEKECPIGAIRVAKDDDEYNKIKDEIDNDPRTIKDLFVDRYGATPLSEFFMIDGSEIENKVKNELTIIELYNNDSIQCLLKSIPIKDLTSDLGKNVQFYKALSNKKVLKNYKITKLPALLIFKNGDYINHIDGYYPIDNANELKAKINEFIRK